MKCVLLLSFTMVNFSSQTIKTGIMSVQRATIIYLTWVGLVIFCIGNNIFFILHHDGWSIGRRSVRRLCLIFHNCSDMKETVNLPIVALTNVSFSGVKLSLFNALKPSTGSGKRMLKSFNLATCQLELIRKCCIDVSGCL